MASASDRTVSVEQLLESVPCGMLVVDDSGCIERANEQIERIFGYSEEQLLGEPVEKLMPARTRAAHVDMRAMFFRDPHPRIMGSGRDLYGVRSDGVEIAVEVGLHPIHTPDGLRVLSSVVDITERKRAEERLSAQARQLARSNTALEEFACIASHDLKEPLRGIQNYVMFLQEDCADKLDESAQHKLAALERLSSRMNELIDALLEYSRVGRTEAAVGPTDIRAVVEEILESVAPLIEQHAVEVRILEPLPRIVCDRVRVGEVFRNLVTNAIKYRGDDSPMIEIGAHPVEAPLEVDDPTSASRPEHPVLFVRDNGIGIPEQHLETIFRMFRRLHARGERGGGVGAGLSIVKRIIELHGGNIAVRSTVGEGTEFAFSIGPTAD